MKILKSCKDCGIEHNRITCILYVCGFFCVNLRGGKIKEVIVGENRIAIVFHSCEHNVVSEREGLHKLYSEVDMAGLE